MKLKNKITVCFIAMAIGGLSFAKSSPKALEYTTVSIDDVGGREIVNAIEEGNWDLVEVILDQGIIKIDDVICTYKTSTYNDPYVFGGRVYGGGLDEMYMPFPTQSGASHRHQSDTSPIVNGVASVVNMTFTLPRSPFESRIAYKGSASLQTIELYGTPLMVACRLGNKFMVKKLLAKGANPNIFIRTGGVKYDMYDQTPPRPWMCALIDTFIRIKGKKDSDMSVCAAMLIEAGAYIPKSTKDDIGRTMLWDAVRLGSPEFIEICVKRFGLNVNEEDNLGRTAAEYSPSPSFGGSPENTFRKLRELGANLSNVSLKPREMDAESTPAGSSMGGNLPRTMPDGVRFGRQTNIRFGSSATKEDHSAEIASLQHRLDALRLDLENARKNRELDVIQGTGWGSASMHEQMILKEIQDCEREIMRLSNL